jgi:hypothetical protein
LGAAKLVPLQDAHPRNSRLAPVTGSTSSKLVKNVLTTPTAGAQTSTHEPKFENGARPAQSSAPTPITFGSAAGKYGRQEPSFPADAITRLSLSTRPIVYAIGGGASSGL